MSKPAPEKPAAAHYDLFLRDGRKTFIFRYRDQGIALDGTGLTWRSGDVERKQAYADIDSIRLQSASLPKSSTLYTCTIAFRDGQQLVVTNASQYGSGDDERTPVYGKFLRDLHKRIPQAERSRIRFCAGNSEGRQRFLWAALIIAALFFVGLPLVLLLYFRELEILWPLLAGAGFIYPLWRSATANEPRTYHCEYLPDELVPAVN